MNRLLVVIRPFRKFCEFVAVLLFIAFWPVSNLYWGVSALLGSAGKAIGIDTTVGGILGAISIFMAFLTPLWAITVMGVFYLATALAIASFRPIPILLLLVAWLELKGLTPPGHIHLGDIPKIYGGEFNWLYPLLYSALAILGGTLIAIAEQRHTHLR